MRVSGSAREASSLAGERARTCEVCTCVHKIIRSFNDGWEERESKGTKPLNSKYMAVRLNSVGNATKIQRQRGFVLMRSQGCADKPLSLEKIVGNPSTSALSFLNMITTQHPDEIKTPTKHIY